MAHIDLKPQLLLILAVLTEPGGLSAATILSSFAFVWRGRDTPLPTSVFWPIKMSLAGVPQLKPGPTQKGTSGPVCSLLPRRAHIHQRLRKGGREHGLPCRCLWARAGFSCNCPTPRLLPVSGPQPLTSGLRGPDSPACDSVAVTTHSQQDYTTAQLWKTPLDALLFVLRSNR